MTGQEILDLFFRQLNDPNTSEDAKPFIRHNIRRTRIEKLNEPICDGDSQCLEFPVEERDGQWFCSKHRTSQSSAQ